MPARSSQPFSDEELARVSQQLGLSPRQHEIVACLVQAMGDRDIASTLGISFNTVRMHLSKLYAKVRVGDRSELLIAVFRQFRDDCPSVGCPRRKGRYVADRQAPRPVLDGHPCGD